MLTIPFSHRYYAKWMNFGAIPLEQETRLVNYCALRELSHELIEYDTRYWEGCYGFEARVKRYPLGPGPYLLCVLATHTGNRLICDSSLTPGWIHWTTIRTPWRRTKKHCDNCAHWLGADQLLCGACTIDNPIHWFPGNRAIPKKYRQARGQKVKIVYRPKGA